MNINNKSALLVIDVQQNLVDPGSRMHIDTGNVNMLFENLNTCIRAFWKKGLPVLYVTNEWTNLFLNLITGNVCKAGARGTGLDRRLHKVNDKIYTKSKSDAFSNQELFLFLKMEGIEDVYLVGLFAEHCIKASLDGALQNDFNVTVVSDALGARNTRSRLRAIRYFKKKATTTTTASVIEAETLSRVNEIHLS